MKKKQWTPSSMAKAKWKGMDEKEKEAHIAAMSAARWVNHVKKAKKSAEKNNRNTP